MSQAIIKMSDVWTNARADACPFTKCELMVADCSAPLNDAKMSIVNFTLMANVTVRAGWSTNFCLQCTNG